MKAGNRPDDKNINRSISRREALKLGGTLLVGATLSGCASRLARTKVTVGDPANPESLPAAILHAYDQGARDISVNRGTYVLRTTGKDGINLTGWKDARICFNGSTIIFEETQYRPVMLRGSSNVALEDAILQFATTSYTQGRITAIAKDTQGNFVDWQIDAGYPTDVNPGRPTYNVIDQNTRLLKVGTGDYGAKDAVLIGAGLYRLRGVNGIIEGAAVNDWLICRAPGGTSVVQLDISHSCTLRGITLKNAGFAAFFETGGNGGHHYIDCRVTRGPKPSGATEEQLVSCGADGFHSTGTRVGPTIERCVWDGVLLDDCIAIHGSFQNVVRSGGNRLILDGRNRAGFAVNEPVRISSRDGFFAEAKCVALRPIETPEGFLELTLDRTLPVMDSAKAGNPERCGKSFKIIGCTLGNTRSRGILVKADDGLIQGCLIEGCGMSAVSIGPEYYWNEANYCSSVTVAENQIRHNSLRNNRNADGVIFVHGEGAVGNRNIKIAGNKFEENYSPYMLNIGWAEGVKIVKNKFDSSSPLRLTEPEYIINLHDVRHIVLEGNTFCKLGPSVTRSVNVGRNVEGLVGNDDSGIRLIKMR